MIKLCRFLHISHQIQVFFFHIKTECVYFKLLGAVADICLKHDHLNAAGILKSIANKVQPSVTEVSIYIFNRLLVQKLKVIYLYILVVH